MREIPISWQLRKGRGGRKKKIPTEGYFCPNNACAYYGITEEAIHALVGYGSHGTQEIIRDLKCQFCGKKFLGRRNKILYQLKSDSGLIEKILWLLALGVHASALEEVFGVRDAATEPCERLLTVLAFVHVKLDEAFGTAKRRANINISCVHRW